MNRKTLVTGLMSVLLFPMSALGLAVDEYVTPNTWSKHVTANGIKSSINGLDYGDSGLLKMNYTTRVQLKFSDESYWSIYEYVRLRHTGMKLGEGEVNFNLNLRGSGTDTPDFNKTNSKYFDGLYAARKYNEFGRQNDYMYADLRIYQANVEINDVVPFTDFDLGRIYLSSLGMYKIDGANINLHPTEYFNIDVYGGLPVSYYSNLKTSMVGTHFEIPVAESGTKIQGEYNYFFHEDEKLNTQVINARIDQAANAGEVFSSNIYGEINYIGKAMLYEAGIDGSFDKTRTGFSAYVMGQYGRNDESINPYVALYEDIFTGSSEYVMGGAKITQGITDKFLFGIGYEGRKNFTHSYGDRNFHRITGNIDFPGLIHRNNYLSFIVDYFDVAQYNRLDRNQRVVGGFKMTQVFNENLEAWIGVNVQNFQYRNSAIKNYPGENRILLDTRDENTTVAYIGALWTVASWCTLQLDYSFEYADIFKSRETQPDIHTVEFWLNFIW